MAYKLGTGYKVLGLAAMLLLEGQVNGREWLARQPINQAEQVIM